MTYRRDLCYIVDIDGTIADNSHRLHHIQKCPKNWDAFFAEVGGDKPIPHMVRLLDDLQQYWVRFVYVTGRPERCRRDTERWLDRNDLPIGEEMYMRADGDRRPDYIVKKEMLDRLLAEGWTPIMAFVDRDSVVAMWRENGVPCAQVAPGAF